MELLKNYEEFKKVFRTGKKWGRCCEAVDNIPNINSGCYYSVGDSLVYMLTDGKYETNGDMIGHRRYMDIHYCISGNQSVEITGKANLKNITPYSDETDYEYFNGNGDTITLTEGNILIIENHEAFRFHESDNAKKLILKVTVEDNFLLNK